MTRNTTTFECETCGSPVEKYPSQIESGKSYYCDTECRGKADRTGRKVSCAFCGETFYKPQWKIDRVDNHFCKQECHDQYQVGERAGEDHPNWQGGKVEVECDNCGATTKRKPHTVNEGNMFCGQECHYEWASENRVGEKSGNWKGGHDYGYGYNWERQRRKALERDSYRCQRCGMTQREHEDQYPSGLHVHHIERKESFRDGNGELDHEAANRLSNLITLCHGCHGKLEGLPIDMR